jgi:hypothetical protein
MPAVLRAVEKLIQVSRDFIVAFERDFRWVLSSRPSKRRGSWRVHGKRKTHLSRRPRSILPLHSPSSRANLLGWLSIDELKPLAEQGKIDLDAPLSVLMEGGADEAGNGEGKKPVKEFKKGRKYEGA